jgi:hypothetical protein
VTVWSLPSEPRCGTRKIPIVEHVIARLAVVLGRYERDILRSHESVPTQDSLASAPSIPTNDPSTDDPFEGDGERALRERFDTTERSLGFEADSTYGHLTDRMPGFVREPICSRSRLPAWTDERSVRPGSAHGGL